MEVSQLEKLHVGNHHPRPYLAQPRPTRVLSLNQTHIGGAEQPRLARVLPLYNLKPRAQP